VQRAQRRYQHGQRLLRPAATSRPGASRCWSMILGGTLPQRNIRTRRRWPGDGVRPHTHGSGTLLALTGRDPRGHVVLSGSATPTACSASVRVSSIRPAARAMSARVTANRSARMSRPSRAATAFQLPELPNARGHLRSPQVQQSKHMSTRCAAAVRGSAGSPRCRLATARRLGGGEPKPRQHVRVVLLAAGRRLTRRRQQVALF
jgi:hypothetical protein